MMRQFMSDDHAKQIAASRPGSHALYIQQLAEFMSQPTPSFAEAMNKSFGAGNWADSWITATQTASVTKQTPGHFDYTFKEMSPEELSQQFGVPVQIFVVKLGDPPAAHTRNHLGWLCCSCCGNASEYAEPPTAGPFVCGECRALR